MLLFGQQVYVFITMEAEGDFWDPIKFINKGIKNLNLPSIFNSSYITSSTPDYLKKSRLRDCKNSVFN